MRCQGNPVFIMALRHESCSARLLGAEFLSSEEGGGVEPAPRGRFLLRSFRAELEALRLHWTGPSSQFYFVSSPRRRHRFPPRRRRRRPAPGCADRQLPLPSEAAQDKGRVRSMAEALYPFGAKAPALVGEGDVAGGEHPGELDLHHDPALDQLGKASTDRRG